MQKRTRNIALAVLGFLLLAFSAFVVLGLSALFSLANVDPHEDSFRHEITYDFGVETNDTLRNATFYAPFPQEREFIRSFRNQSENSSVINDFNGTAELVELNNSVMLEIEAERIRPETNNGFTRPAEFIFSKNYNRSLNTSKGLEAEPSIPTERRSRKLEGCSGEECFRSETEVFADYETGNSTQVSTELRLDGWNEWFTTGWSGNTYSQSFSTGYYTGGKINGSKSSWIELQGEETQGDGNYRKN